MFGFFVNELSQRNLSTLSADEVRQLEPGTPIAVVQNPDLLVNEGRLSPHFFIALKSDISSEIIVQRCISESWDSPCFIVVREEYDIHFYNNAIFYRYPVQADCSLSATIQRALSRLDIITNEMRSYPGDDFVDECLTGRTMTELFSDCCDSISGQHWWTPLSVPIKELVDALYRAYPWVEKKVSPLLAKDWIKKYAEKVGAQKTPEVQHHGILIENHRVIHFSNYEIRTDSLDTFLNTTPGTQPGGPVAVGSPQLPENVEARLRARNKALWVLCQRGQNPNYWGNYNLLMNNCEHFSRMCRENRFSSLQVRNQATNLAIEAISCVLPGPVGVFLPTLAKHLLEDGLEPAKPEDLVRILNANVSSIKA